MIIHQFLHLLLSAHILQHIGNTFSDSITKLFSLRFEELSILMCFKRILLGKKTSCLWLTQSFPDCFLMEGASLNFLLILLLQHDMLQF